MRPVRIAGLGEARPARSVGNDELADLWALRTDDAWIRSRTGIARRGLAGPEESVLALASAAAGKALAAAGRDPGDVGLVLVATASAPSPMPSIAAGVAAALGSSCGASDLNAACAGFCYALALAAASVRAGDADCAVVVGAERMTDLLDTSDRSTAVLFGDGAAAAVLVAGQPGDPDGIGPVAWGSDGGHGDLLAVDPGTRTLQMAGPAVYRWATGLGDVARRACAQAGVAPSALAGFVSHQGNRRIVDALAADLLGPDSPVAVARDVVDAGNTGAASVPLAFARLLRETPPPPGAPVLLLGFGAGLSYAAQVVLSP